MSNHASSTDPPAVKRGYHKLAIFMASEKDIAIFRRFSKLNMLNLMSLQAELIALEEDYDVVWDADEKDATRRVFSVSFNTLRTARADTPDDNSEAYIERQWQILMAIRNKLNEYNDTLLQVAKVYSLDEPEAENVKILRDWLERKDYGNGEITGAERKAWVEPDEKAPFSSWVTGGLLTTFHDRCGFRMKCLSTPGDPEAGPDIAVYRNTSLARSTRSLVMVLASLLPVVCIVVLNTVESTGWRLGTTAFFTAAFASVLVIFISVKEVEIFAVTAAFAAVEVVFIGTALSSSSDNSTRPS
ncbi:uncharacterized protein RSE6_00845 [Rhynchosporium secalis]|uniref:DUF6594 domain-containing protein n=1 Tax=Rhynchosporium secalis TaxID=38038 RepID=A0A1E1LXX7_RHYSE|nr:uncharacterized protein RSE6_00845 [Rhynchosporium secalis]